MASRDAKFLNDYEIALASGSSRRSTPPAPRSW